MATKVGCYRRDRFMPKVEPWQLAKPESKRMSVAENIRHLVLETDWDRELIGRQKMIDGLCKGIVVFAGLYFLPIIMNIFWR